MNEEKLILVKQVVPDLNDYSCGYCIFEDVCMQTDELSYKLGCEEGYYWDIKTE